MRRPLAPLLVVGAAAAPPTTTSAGAFAVAGPPPTAPRSSCTRTRLRGLPERLEALLLGGLSGSGDGAPSRSEEELDPEAELANLPSLARGSREEAALAHASLTSYLRAWGRLLEGGELGGPSVGSGGLATPVAASAFDPPPRSDGSAGGATRSSGLRLMFRPPKRYLSYNEQRDLEKGIVPDRKGAKLDAWSPGGIEVLVQTVAIATGEDDKGSGGGEEELRLMARRCDIDGDTVIKVTSERAVIRRLQEAVKVWVKMRQEEE